MERVGGFGGKADQLNAYYTAGDGRTTSPKTSRGTRRCSAADIQAAVVRRGCPADRRVELIVEPEAKK